MDAREARALANEDDLNVYEVENFLKEVKNVATGKSPDINFGRTGMRYDKGLLSNGSVKFLKKKGYAFTLKSDPRDGDYYEVKW